VDYPVVQAKDNTYYLTHDAEKAHNKHEAIFTAVIQNSLKGNNILYGHHMKDGSMFAFLVQYKDEAFFKSHPTIEFATLEKHINGRYMPKNSELAQSLKNTTLGVTTILVKIL